MAKVKKLLKSNAIKEVRLQGEAFNFADVMLKAAPNDGREIS